MQSKQPEEPDAPLILVADDDPDIQALVRYRLERCGYRVVTANDGEEAVHVARAMRPVLVVLDVMMPRVDGLQATRQLRADAETSAIPIVLLTARAQDTDVGRGFEAGADDYIRKPFSPQELSARVHAILGRR
jgi:DNA-binding response OmpR family regulator